MGGLFERFSESRKQGRQVGGELDLEAMASHPESFELLGVGALRESVCEIAIQADEGAQAKFFEGALPIGDDLDLDGAGRREKIVGEIDAPHAQFEIGEESANGQGECSGVVAATRARSTHRRFLPGSQGT
jgi:hypothetical protein